MKETRHVVSFSGGKDSTALLLLAIKRCKPGTVVPIFCDTGHEHAETYAYLDYIESTLGITINRLKADFSDLIARKRMFIARDQRTKRDKNGRLVRWTNKAKRRALEVLYPTGSPYLDMCMIKGRFPSRLAQFCTEELKKNPAIRFQLSLLDQGFRVISWQGVRRDESHARKNAKKWQRLSADMYAFRPLVEWTAMDVVRYVQENGLKLNPLYSQGMNRVGCMPCINASKSEINEIARRFPDEMKRVERWEEIVSKAGKLGFATFFHASKTKRDTNKGHFEGNKIEQVIQWGKTSRGGLQYDIFAAQPSTQCASSYGLCE